MEKLVLNTDTILVHYNLPRLREGKLVDEWTAAKGDLLPEEMLRLQKLHKKTLQSGDGWNEEELKMKFISLIFDLVDIEVDGLIVSFYERTMTAVVSNLKINVICDCLLASPAGIATPRMPYFFLQEAPSQPSPKGKENKNDSNDPEAQMLAAMLVAQHLNADEKPIYGAWLVGSIWNFTVLYEGKYYVSRKFDAGNMNDLIQIVFILRKLKTLILER